MGLYDLGTTMLLKWVVAFESSSESTLTTISAIAFGVNTNRIIVGFTNPFAVLVLDSAAGAVIAAS